MIEALQTKPDEPTEPAVVAKQRSWPPLILLAVVVLLDRATKVIAQHFLELSLPIPLWGDIVRFEYAENTGAFLSLGAGLPESVRFMLFGVIVALLLVVMVVYLVRSRTLLPWEAIALSLVVGGGTGNLFDRLTAGYVVDFVSIGIGSVRTGIFNVADVAITAGVLLLLAGRFLPKRQSPPSSL